jgi:hypothetical protein
MKPIDVFNKNWLNVIDDMKNSYKIDENITLDDNEHADIAIFKDNICLAFGNYFNKLVVPTDDNLRDYFHGKNGFIGCGTSSKFWFYFDDDRIIINDLRYVYPCDELMNDYNEFFSRITLEII